MSPTNSSKMNAYTLLMLVLTGLVAGALSGILGIGGGIILIPALVYLLGFSQFQAVGTSLAVMLPPIGVFAAYNYYKEGNVNMLYAIILAVVFMIGSYLTSKVAVKLPENVVRKAFSLLLFFTAIKMFFSK
jgi:uncharacterized membrane protein YfcA